MILCANPLAQYNSYKQEIDEAVAKVLNKGWYILGEEVGMFEKEFAEYNLSEDERRLLKKKANGKRKRKQVAQTGTV